MGGQVNHIERWIDDSGRQQVRGVQRHVLRRGSRGGHSLPPVVAAWYRPRESGLPGSLSFATVRR